MKAACYRNTNFAQYVDTLFIKGIKRRRMRQERPKQVVCDSKQHEANTRHRYTIPKNYHGITVGTVARLYVSWAETCICSQ